MAADDANEQHRAKLRSLLEEGGADQLIAFIQATPEPELRRTLHSLARRAFPVRDAGGRRFDDLIRVARAGIAEDLRQAELARARSDGDLATRCVDAANMLAYNLAADLADCWPEDAAPRERRHFEAGLRAAHECVVWRQELGKSPDRRAMAYWAMGMHQLSLGNLVEALGAFETAFGLSVQAVAGRAAAAPEEAAAHVKPGGDFGVILNAGYAGIARKALGDPAGAEQYEKARAAFTETAAKFPDQKEDATFGLDQLRVVEKKFGASGRSS